MMTYDRIRSDHDALVYFLDCQLATVSSMAMRKSRAKYEYQRQISIAQRLIDYIRTTDGEIDTGHRMIDVLEAGDVAKWAQQYEN